MQCPYCGEDHPDNALFCPKFGTALQKKPAAQFACPRCEFSLQEDWTACPNCGYLLDDLGTMPDPVAPDLASDRELAHTQPGINIKQVWAENTTRFYWLAALAGFIVVAIAVYLFAFRPITTDQSGFTGTAQSTPALAASKTQTPAKSATAARSISTTPTLKVITPTRTATAVATMELNSSQAAIKFLVETVDASRKAGAYNSLVFDANHLPSLVYLKDNPDLGNGYDRDQAMFAQRVQGRWSIQPLTSGGKNEGYGNSLVIDSQGQLQLIYYGYDDQQLFYTVKRGAAAWTGPRPISGTINRARDGGTGTANIVPRVDLALDANDILHISYLDLANKTLMYLRSDENGNNDLRVVTSGVAADGYSFPIALDLDQNPIIAFYNPNGTPQRPAGLQVARLSGAEWKIETIDPNPNPNSAVGLFPALAVGSNGSIYVVYYDSYLNNLKMSVFDGSRWRAPIEVDPHGGKYAMIALDKNQQVHVAYYDEGSLSLKYASGDTAGFQTAVVVQSGVTNFDKNNKPEKYLSLALDSNDNPWISFYDPVDMNLKIAHLDSIK